MEVYDSRERSKRGLTPKVTHTNIVSIKRTPFIIRKHHMDDTGMRDVFSQDHAPYGSPRIYQYEGELARLVRTPIKDNARESDRHSAKKEKEFVGSETERYVFEEKHLESGVETPRPDSHSRSKVDEMHKIAKVTRRLKEEADRYRDMVKDRVEQDILREGSGVLNELERDIRNLKIRNMQKEKDQLERSIRRQAKSAKANDFDQYQGQEKKTHTKVVIQKQRGRFKWWTDVLQRKPRFRVHANPDTDSSFSSFQL